jgi:hypothetical protein
LKAELGEGIPLKDISIPLGDNGSHRGFLTLSFESHDIARAAFETLMTSRIAPRGLAIRFAAARPGGPAPSPYEDMLHKVRARMVATQEENYRLRAEMETLTKKLQKATQKD